MRQVVSYKRLKTIEIINRQAQKMVTVAYRRFQLLGFDWENFGFFDGRSLMGGIHSRFLFIVVVRWLMLWAPFFSAASDRGEERSNRCG